MRDVLLPLYTSCAMVYDWSVGADMVYDLDEVNGANSYRRECNVYFSEVYETKEVLKNQNESTLCEPTRLI